MTYTAQEIIERRKARDKERVGKRVRVITPEARRKSTEWDQWHRIHVLFNKLVDQRNAAL
jgi:hypothetical protein